MRFRDLTRCKPKHSGKDLRFAGHQTVAIHQKKKFESNEDSAFVSVYKGIVLDKCKGVGGRELSNIGFSICGFMLWSCQSHLQETRIADTRPAAVFGYLRVMDRENRRGAHPPPSLPHLASSRSRWRRFFVMRRASVI